MQHAPWLQWARQFEPLVSLESCDGALSKRKLLQLFPQVYARALMPEIKTSNLLPFTPLGVHSFSITFALPPLRQCRFARLVSVPHLVLRSGNILPIITTPNPLYGSLIHTPHATCLTFQLTSLRSRSISPSFAPSSAPLNPTATPWRYSPGPSLQP